MTVKGIKMFRDHLGCSIHEAQDILQSRSEHPRREQSRTFGRPHDGSRQPKPRGSLSRRIDRMRQDTRIVERRDDSLRSLARICAGTE
ncbi:hypothetical protein ABZY81_37670 [Streptomyces sp. NPDC006514]|uniref:hypothetical protein n=1 Tax=Streptomyces sp. NPDC006514 TaxID=3154308 RepID=UPI0033B9DDF6